MQLDVKAAANGKWHGILAGYGLTDKQLAGKHTACPFCEGTDRFRLTDFRGNGEWICNQCGKGNGFDLVMKLRGIDFKEAIKEIAPKVGSFQAREKEKKSAEQVRRQLHGLFIGATRKVINPYLANRGITVAPDVWYHPEMAYYDEGKRTLHHGMIGIVTNPEGENIAAHRTYLTPDGKKANVPSPKKLTEAISTVSGGAIRLFQHSGCLGIAEGIETACAAFQLFGIPAWAAISAHGLETFKVPGDVTKLVIFGDNDKSFTGQAAANNLAKRYPEISEVRIPEKVGADWADYV